MRTSGNREVEKSRSHESSDPRDLDAFVARFKIITISRFRDFPITRFPHLEVPKPGSDLAEWKALVMDGASYLNLNDEE